MAFKGCVAFLDKILGKKWRYMKIKTCETAMLTIISPYTVLSIIFPSKHPTTGASMDSAL